MCPSVVGDPWKVKVKKKTNFAIYFNFTLPLIQSSWNWKKVRVYENIEHAEQYLKNV